MFLQDEQYSQKHKEKQLANINGRQYFPEFLRFLTPENSLDHSVMGKYFISVEGI